MFSTISWSSYIAAVFVLLVLWYSYVSIRFYYPWMQQVFSGRKNIVFANTGKANKEKNSNGCPNIESQNKKLFLDYNESFSTLEDAEELSNKIADAIAESSSKDLSRQEFKNYMQLILNEYPYVKASSLRERINTLIISECEKHQQIILTHAEVNILWDELL